MILGRPKRKDAELVLGLMHSSPTRVNMRVFVNLKRLHKVVNLYGPRDDLFMGGLRHFRHGLSLSGMVGFPLAMSLRSLAFTASP